MKGCLVAAAVALLVLLLFGGCAVGTYNGIIDKEERTEAAWSEIHNQYQRRSDLVPQLVETVKGAKDFEQSTLQAVVEARASVGKLALPAKTLEDPAAMQAFVEANDQLGSALRRLLVVAEAYPELKTTQSFLSLQDQIEGTENRITTARRDYIESVRAYNVAIRRFPGNVVAGLSGFEAHPQLEVPEGVTERPVIDFGQK